MKRFGNLKSHMVMSTIAALFVGVIVLFGTRFVEQAIIWVLAPFIVSPVIIPMM